MLVQMSMSGTATWCQFFKLKMMGFNYMTVVLLIGIYRLVLSVWYACYRTEPQYLKNRISYVSVKDLFNYADIRI